MNGREYAEHLGVPHGTVKRWLIEGLPATRGTPKSRLSIEIDPAVADAWVKANRPNSVSFSRASSIYFARREDGAIKIGWTSDVLRRVHELRRDGHTAITLLAVLPGDKPDELVMHKRFAAHRLDGEWFAPNTEIDALLASLKRVA